MFSNLFNARDAHKLFLFIAVATKNIRGQIYIFYSWMLVHFLVCFWYPTPYRLSQSRSVPVTSVDIRCFGVFAMGFGSFPGSRTLTRKCDLRHSANGSVSALIFTHDLKFCHQHQNTLPMIYNMSVFEIFIKFWATLSPSPGPQYEDFE